MGKIYHFILFNLAMSGLAVIFLSGCNKDDSGFTLKDIDGNEYNSVKIGTQTWMVENLKTTKFSDGTDIPLIATAEAWMGLTSPGFQWYNGDILKYKNPYGALYNFYAVSTAKLCPAGWHVPSNSEWTTLTTFLLGEDVAGGKLKEAGITHWKSPNGEATNESGFTALPGGAISSGGLYDGIGYEGAWWAADEDMNTDIYCRILSYYWGRLQTNHAVKQSGFSVRCVKN